MDLLQQYAKFLANGGLIPYALEGLDYLRRAVLGNPPATTGTGEPYTPPFSGGQCSNGYTVFISFVQLPSNVRTSPFSAGTTSARISGVSTFNTSTSNTAGIVIQSPSGDLSFQVNSNFAKDFKIESLVRNGGLPDNCGDLPNPNPAPSPASDGLATSAPPDFGSAATTGVVNGTALASDGSTGLLGDAQDDFTDAGALAPTDIAGAIEKIAAGLAKLIQVVTLINELIALLKKLFNKDNKSSFRYDFGNLRYDGFVRLQSEPPAANITPLYLDLQVTNVKVGASRIFGEKSPNYYNREPIGYIHFVSPTFGVLSSHEIRFTRTSIPIPPLSYGFFYNLGLDGVNRVNATGFYLKQEE
jgi:hypothetical protein